MLWNPFPVVSLETCSLGGNSPRLFLRPLSCWLFSQWRNIPQTLLSERSLLLTPSCPTIVCLLPALYLQHFPSSRVLPPHRHLFLHHSCLVPIPDAWAWSPRLLLHFMLPELTGTSPCFSTTWDYVDSSVLFENLCSACLLPLLAFPHLSVLSFSELLSIPASTCP